MRGFLIRGLLSALGLWVASAILPGVHSTGILSLVGAGLLLGAVNAVVRPIVIFLTLPITILTLGLFLLVVNAAMVGLVAKMLNGLSVDSFWWALWTAVIVSLVSWGGSAFVGNRGRIEVFSGRRPR